MQITKARIIGKKRQMQRSLVRENISHKASVPWLHHGLEMNSAQLSFLLGPVTYDWLDERVA